MKLFIVINKGQIYPVNTRYKTHHTSTHITQSIKLGYHRFNYPFIQTTLSQYRLVILKSNQISFAISVTTDVTATGPSVVRIVISRLILTARMLLNYSKQVQHFSHEHWLTFDWVRRGDRKYQCAACRQFCDGDIYCCKRCYFFLHRSCAEYPTKIQLSLHSNHPLTLRTGTAKIRECCDFCNLTCQALTFRCDPCNFKIDFSCVCMLINFPELNKISHFSHHHHSLKLNNNAMNDDAFCYACKKPLR